MSLNYSGDACTCILRSIDIIIKKSVLWGNTSQTQSFAQYPVLEWTYRQEETENIYIESNCPLSKTQINLTWLHCLREILTDHI